MKLTPAQALALSKITSKWRSAYEIGAGLNTLNALAKKGGLVERRTTSLGSLFSPRTANKYRLLENKAK